ncbi:MAG: hypothetical protein WC718_16735 [Phycisphaerales bacterium]|jgi:hypothetical protein
MTLKDLLEQAHLDALGMLDEQEAAAFEAAFRAASPAVKAQIREDQARWASQQIMLSDETPSADLRARVVAAIDREVAARAHAELEAESPEFELRPSRRVASSWRTAGVALLCASVILAVAFVKVYSDNAEMQQRLTDDRQLTALTNLWGNGQQLNGMLFGQETRHAIFEMAQGAPADFHGQAGVFMNPTWAKARIFVSGLTAKPGENYRLVVLSDTDVIEKELAIIAPGAGLQTTQIDGISKGMRLALVSTKMEMPATSGLILMITNV